MNLVDGRIEEVVDLFESNDTDCDGDIGLAEFHVLMRELDPAMSAEALSIGFHEIDTNKDGRIDLAEFLDWWRDD